MLNKLRARWRDASGVLRGVTTNRLHGEEEAAYLARHYDRLGDDVATFPPAEDGSYDPTVMFDIAAAQDAVGKVDGAAVLTVDGATGNFGFGGVPLADKAFRFGTSAASNALVIDDRAGVYNGFIGIGTSTPDVAIDIQKPTNAGIRIQSQGVDSDATLFLSNDAIQWTLRCGADDKFHLRNFTSGDDLLTVDGGTGYLGIGMTPENALSILVNDSVTTGTAQIQQSGAGDASIRFRLTGVVSYGIGVDNTDSRFKISATSDIGGSTAISIDISSNVVIGPNARQAGSKFDVQTTGLAHAVVVDDTTGRTSFGSAATTAMVVINQANTTAAVPVLLLDQDDTNQPFVDYVGATAANANNSISSWTTGATAQGFVRVMINGTVRWMPFYDAPTGA